MQRLGDGAPGIAAIGHEGEGCRQRRRVLARFAMEDLPQIMRRVAELPDFRQELGDLDIGLIACAQTAVKLEDDLVAKGDRDIALFGPQRPGFTQIAKGEQGLTAFKRHFASVRAQRAPLLHGRHQRPIELPVQGTVDQHALALSPLKASQNRRQRR